MHRPYDNTPDPGFNPWLIRVPVLLFSGAVLLFMLLILLVALFQIGFRDRVMPGVSAYNVDLTGMTRDQARAALETQFTYADRAVFTFRDGDRFWQATARELGVDFDTPAAVDQVFAVGRGDGMLFNLFNQGMAWLNGARITPVVRYDQGMAAAWLARIASEVDRAAVDARLHIDGMTITAVPAQEGRWLDIPATLSQLDAAITRLMPGGEVALIIHTTPPTAFDAEAAASKARIALSAPLVLVAEQSDGAPAGPWIASVDQIAALLRVVRVQDGRGGFRYDVTADMTAFRGYLESLAAGLLGLPQNARYDFDDATGNLTVIQSSRSGRTLNVDETLRRMNDALFSTSRTVPIAFDYILPPYHSGLNATDLNIRELIGRGRTSFAGSSQARRANIAQSAARFNGLIIAPGEVFSFNGYLGDITPEEGYIASRIIVGGRTVDGVGGGVCQVSTTMFQAAFYAGYPIVERYAHSYRVAYYERGEGIGMDAAIYKPTPDDSPFAQELDLRFLNDTPYHMLIEMSFIPDRDELEFRFYSTSTGRQVVKRGPEVANERPPAETRYEANPSLQPGQEIQVDYAARGAEVRVTRLILDASGAEIRRDLFYSNYQPWGAIIQVAPGDARLRG
jgi:vancomycin resistance protein YoaR